MKTPEGYEKDEIKTYLKSIGAYYFMPVQVGYGAHTVDILSCINGVFWGIEVKRPGKVPTGKQELMLAAIRAAGGEAVAGPANVVIGTIEGWLAGRKAGDPGEDLYQAYARLSE